jgi:hypothetical protein
MPKMLSDPIISTLEKIIALHDGIAEPASTLRRK